MSINFLVFFFTADEANLQFRNLLPGYQLVWDKLRCNLCVCCISGGRRTLHSYWGRCVKDLQAFIATLVVPQHNYVMKRWTEVTRWRSSINWSKILGTMFCVDSTVVSSECRLTCHQQWRVQQFSAFILIVYIIELWVNLLMIMSYIPFVRDNTNLHRHGFDWYSNSDSFELLYHCWNVFVGNHSCRSAGRRPQGNLHWLPDLYKVW